MYNVYDAKDSEEFGLIPDGTLISFTIEVRPYNAHQNIIDKPSRSTPDARYLDLELTVDEGPYKGRKLWEMLITKHPEGKGVEACRSAIKAILECNGANPQRPSDYAFASYAVLNGKRGIGKVKIEPGTEDKQSGKKYADKNRISTWISPVSQRSAKLFAEFMAQRRGDGAVMAPAAPVATSAMPAVPHGVTHTAALPWAAPATAPATAPAPDAGLPQGPAAWPAPPQQGPAAWPAQPQAPAASAPQGWPPPSAAPGHRPPF